MPKSCDAGIVVPSDIRFLFWGYPNRLQARFADTTMGVMLMGPIFEDKPPNAINTLDDLKVVPTNWSGWVYTNKVEVIGPVLRERKGHG